MYVYTYTKAHMGTHGCTHMHMHTQVLLGVVLCRPPFK